MTGYCQQLCWRTVHVLSLSLSLSLSLYFSFLDLDDMFSKVEEN